MRDRRWVGVSLLAVSLLSASCHERPFLLVSVARSGVDLTFTFGFCDRPGDDPAVYLFELARIVEGKRIEVCATRTPQPSLTLGKTWVMGDARKGITLDGCGSAPPGEYLVSVRGAGRGRGMGFRYFTLSGAGDVSSRQGSCDR
jgi:hypothetical protein